MINILIFAAFVLVIAVILILDRKNIKREGIILIRRTQKGVNFIDRVAKKFPRFWNVFSIIGVIVAIGAMFFVSYFIAMSAIDVAAGGVEGVKLVLPGPVDAAVSVPGVFIVPWYFWVIGIFSLIIPHEFSHGIMSRLRKVKVKTVGWLLLVLLPGAFVEPDEKQLKKASAGTKLRIYAAGSFANFVMALIFIVILLIYISATTTASGVFYTNIEPDSPLDNANITAPILSINNIPTISKSGLVNVLSSIPAGTVVNVETVRGNYSIQTVEHETVEGSLGIVFVEQFNLVGDITEYRAIRHDLKGPITTPIIVFLGKLLQWIFMLNLGVGLVNLLPLKPLDGGLIMETIVEKINGKKSRATMITVKVISAGFLLLLLYSVLGALI